MGSVIAMMKGTDRRKTSRMTLHGRPFPTRFPNCWATWRSSIRRVNAASANPSGARCWRSGPHTVPALVAAAWERRARALWSPVLGRPAAPAPVAAAAPSPIPAEPAPPVVVPAAAPALPGTFADVGMQLNVRFELKADQFRNPHCSAIDLQQALSGCSAGFPTISPNPQYSIRPGGVLGQRLHLNVDLDSH